MCLCWLQNAPLDLTQTMEADGLSKKYILQEKNGSQ